MNSFLKWLSYGSAGLLLVTHASAIAEGDKGEIKAEMALKNRGSAPSKTQIDSKVTLDAMLGKSTADAWPRNTGARIEGVVVQVENEADGDMHIVLAPPGGETDTKHWVIAEVPKSTRSHNKSLAPDALMAMRGKKVAVTGWLYYEPDDESSDPRGTRWEIHPVTSIQAE